MIATGNCKHKIIIVMYTVSMVMTKLRISVFPKIAYGGRGTGSISVG